MKVAIVTWKFPALSNTFILNEIVEVLRQGLEVAIYSIDRSDDAVVHDDVARYALLERTWFLGDFQPRPGRQQPELAKYAADWLGERVHGLPAMAEHMRRSGVDLVHGCFANNSATVAMATARLAGLPFTFECHAYDLFVDMRYADEKVAEARRVFSISEYNRDHLVRSLGCASDKVVIRRVPILQEYCDSVEDVERTPGLIVAVARLIPIKGFDLALAALAQVLPAVPNARLAIVGEGPLRAELAEQARRLGLGSHVEFVGTLTNRATLRLVRRASAFVLPSRIGQDGDRDGIPTSLIEAMYLRTPVVSTRVSGIPELIDDGVNGLLAESEDVPGIAEALRRLLTDDGLRERLGHAGHAKVVAEFEVERNIGILVAHWRELAREERPRPIRAGLWSRVRVLFGG
jgi:colanic acid/amylovoran biosynthesis glycosyltransferase